MSTLPVPPVPAGLDLRHFDCMHLDTERLLKSDIWDECTGDEIALALKLWAVAWQQIPTGSLPNSETKVMKLLMFQKGRKFWNRVRAGALRGFRLCRDGRLYHLVVCEQALKAEKRSRAGKRGAKVRWSDDKPLENNETTDATASKTASSTKHSNGDGKRDDIIYSNGDGGPHAPSDAEKGRESPSPLPPSSAPAVSGLGGPASRPTETPEQREVREAAAERKALEVNGNRYRVDPNGYVVLVETSGAVNAMHDLADDEIEPREAGDPRLWPVAPEGAVLGRKIVATPCKPETAAMVTKPEFDPVRDMPLACRRVTA